MLKTIGSSEKLALKAFRVDNNEVIEVGSKANRMVVNLSKNKKSKKLTHMPNIGAMGKSNFLTPNAKESL